MTASSSRQDFIRFVLEYLVIDAVFAYFFYQSVIAFLLMLPGAHFYVRVRRRSRWESLRRELAMQFKDCLCAVEGSMAAGISLENAFIQSLEEMKRLYGDEGVIVKELVIIKKGLDNNYPIAAALSDMNQKWNIREIRDLIGLLSYGKQRGGSMINILHSYVYIYEARMEVSQEISAMVSARRYEQRIMNVVPFFILFYVNLTNKGFFQVLYHNPAGVVIMTVAMGIYLLSIYLSNRIINIEM